jgi:hypothetical protein
LQAGNPLFDQDIDLGYAPLEYAWGHRMVDEDTHDIIVQQCNYSSSAVPNQACSDAQSVAHQASSSPYLDDYDVLEDVCLTSGQQARTLKAMVSKRLNNINKLSQQFSFQRRITFECR